MTLVLGARPRTGGLDPVRHTPHQWQHVQQSTRQQLSHLETSKEQSQCKPLKAKRDLMIWGARKVERGGRGGARLPALEQDPRCLAASSTHLPPCSVPTVTKPTYTGPQQAETERAVNSTFLVAAKVSEGLFGRTRKRGLAAGNGTYQVIPLQHTAQVLGQGRQRSGCHMSPQMLRL